MCVNGLLRLENKIGRWGGGEVRQIVVCVLMVMRVAYGAVLPLLLPHAERLAAPLLCDRLSSALGAMPTAQTYNTVLISLLSAADDAERRKSLFSKAVEIIEEMNARGIAMSSDTVSVLMMQALDRGIDGVAEAQRLARPFCLSYGDVRWQPSERPAAAELATLRRPPEDDRMNGALAAGAAALAVGATVAAPGLALPAIFSGWAFDRYNQGSDLFETIGKTVGRAFASREVSRESALEAASLLVGYLLGLPCCAFAPTPETALELLELQTAAKSAAIAVGQVRLVDRLLVWLLAATAHEELAFAGQPLVSDPTAARTLLETARRREARLGVDVLQGGWRVEEDDGRLAWAYAEARALLQRTEGLRAQLQEAMLSGSSFGDCVVQVERQLGGTSEGGGMSKLGGAPSAPRALPWQR